jgi:flagellar hook-associated protein 1 FlgK
MSLFGAIQLGGNTLRTMQIGLQVVGNNIANANTPGYIRQEAIYTPAGVQRQGNLILGLGVQVDSIIQKVDRFVQERLVGARGDRANAEVQEKVYRDLEVLLNELSEDVDLSSALTGFFNAVDEILQDPGNVATRHQAIGKGAALTENIGNLHSRAVSIQQKLNDQVTAITDEINVLAEEIRRLNIQIATAEGGDTSGSDAGALRVERQNAVDRLSEIIGIQISEQTSGGLNISIGGEFLVFEGQRRAVELNTSESGGAQLGIVQFVDTESELQTSSGELHGLYTSRDEIVAGFIDKLDELAGTLAFEFNKVFAQGQGLVGYEQLSSVDAVIDSSASLDAAGLAFTPVSGVFDVLIHSKDDDLTTTHTIHIDLDGLDEDTTLTELAAELDTIDGLTASVSTSGRLELAAESADVEFAFSGDTSGVLAALGLNTFFTGSSAGSLSVNPELTGVGDAAKFAASLGGIGEDSRNAERLAEFLDQPLESAGNASLANLYNQLLNEITQGSSVTQSVAEGFRVFEGTLDGQNQAVSGVSIDEEAIKMITLQRIYQASARYIQTVVELLDVLVNI